MNSATSRSELWILNSVKNCWKSLHDIRFCLVIPRRLSPDERAEDSCWINWRRDFRGLSFASLYLFLKGLCIFNYLGLG